MLRELKLVGDIESVELKEGTLTISIDGEEQSYPVGAYSAPVETTDRPRRGRKPKEDAAPEAPAAQAPAEAPAPAAPPASNPNGIGGPAQVKA